MSTKKEYLKAYQDKTLKPIAVIPISNNCGIEILGIENDEKVIGVYNNNDVFIRKLYHTKNDVYFKLGSLKFSIGEAILVYQD